MAARKYYNNKDYFVDLENHVLVLSDKLYATLNSNNKWTKYKKIGGSSIGDILLKDEPFKSEFSAFCHITRLKLPVLVDKYVHAGIILEPIIFDKLRKNQPNKELAKIINYEAANYNYDYFAGLDPIFGGVPDGYMCSYNEIETEAQINKLKERIAKANLDNDIQLVNNLNDELKKLEAIYKDEHSKGVIIEIKTAGEKKLEKWATDGVELSYRKQSQLYAYLNGNYKYVIVALFLQENDYLDPQNVDLDKRNMRSYKFEINENEVRDDIATVRQWYEKYTSTKISPKFDLSKDQDQIDYLLCENEEQWQTLLDEWKKIGKADLDKTI
ncbi:MAGa7180 family putative nuclease [Mycoplasma buteonis]|uniref:MAGa7180 family putative nuclease n=1 Tax=Mycoplasma buteonis TaxID=171280 RepID=UPI00056D3E4F|nr:hypothetical protein [Mycoplasma buteonis]